MKIVFKTQKGEHSLNLDFSKGIDNTKKGAKRVGNVLKSGAGSVIGTAIEGLSKIKPSPSDAYTKQKASNKLEKEQIDNAIKKRKEEIKALQKGI